MKSSPLSRLPLTIALSLAALSAGHAAEILGYYNFEDDYNDSSGNSNNAVLGQNSDELSFVDGLRGKGLSINDPDANANSGGSLNIPINVNPSELPGVTFGGWVNVAKEFEFDGFMAIDNGGWDRGITVNAQESSSFGIASGEDPTHGGAITPGEWQYVVGTFDSVEGTATVYVGDSVAVTQRMESAAGSDLTDVGEPVLELGRYDNQDYHGLVDDIFVFNEALDAHHVGAIRNLRLSALDYTPAEAATLFVLFASGQSGVIREIGWAPVSGLVSGTPGAVTDVGDGNFIVVLDDAGNGMQSGADAEKDADGDGLDDIWETKQFGNLDQGAADDPDEDTLTNLEEFDAGTRPTVKDTDRDGLDDGAEIATHMTDPLNIDSDGDGVSDGAELATGTDPNDPASLPLPPPPELLAYYDFEGSLDDLSGNDNIATSETNPDEVTFTEGLRGQGVDINDPDAEPNSGGLVTIPLDVNPTVQPDVSFGGWINVEEGFEFDGFMAIDNGGWDRGITVNAQESNSFGVASGAAPVNVGEITPGDWQYVVATFSESENIATVYVGNADAAILTTETADTPDAGKSEGEPTIELGRYDNQDLNAAADDIFVFSGALSAHQVNAIRNLRLSAINYTPAEAAQLFELFSAESSGIVGAFTWAPVSGLAPTPPGAVIEAGAGFTVVLDESGNGMMSSAAPRFQISSIVREALTSATLTWNSRTDVVYAVDASSDLITWKTLAEALLPAGVQTSYTDTSADMATMPQRYYRVREQEPPVLYAEGFENGNEGWTVGVLEGFSVTDTTWEVGAPSNNGPAAAFAGENVYGTDLDGNYADGTGIYLRSPIIDLTGAGRAKLTFQYFMAAADNEGGRLNILDPDGTPILAGLKLYIGPDGNTADWTGESIRLPELDRPVIIEFELLSGADDDPINRAGWFIDEIIVD
ncbi:MAG: hypothetical protein ACI8T1_002400 [Verrucomicrobiales bacterium]|jgi:hypothetical protein